MAQYASMWKADALIKLPGDGATQKGAKTVSMELPYLKTTNLERLALLLTNEKNLLPATRVAGAIYDYGISGCAA